MNKVQDAVAGNWKALSESDKLNVLRLRGEVFIAASKSNTHRDAATLAAFAERKPENLKRLTELLSK